MKQNNEKDNHEVQYSGQATFPPHSKLIADSTLDPHSSTGSKRNSGSKVPKDAKFETQRSNAGNCCLTLIFNLIHYYLL